MSKRKTVKVSIKVTGLKQKYKGSVKTDADLTKPENAARLAEETNALVEDLTRGVRAELGL